MILTTTVKLVLTEDQKASLLKTMERFNSACNYIAEVAYANKVANRSRLHRLVYYDVRERFRLSAAMTVRAINKVCETYKRDKSIQPYFRPHGAIVYNRLMLSREGTEYVSLLTLRGRSLVRFRAGKAQAALLSRPWREVDLLYRDNTFYLSICVDVPEPPPDEPTGFLGVDLGIANIATTSDGQTFAGNHLQNVRARFSRLRAKLQRKGTKSAKRLLKRRSRRERRFQRDLNHRIAKAIVTQAKDTRRGIALEDLTHIRSRDPASKSLRQVIHSWAFRQLREFVEYKARRAGVKVVIVDPRNTSRTCSVCGHVDKANRPDQATFRCVACGFAANADHNAALVIAARAGLSCRAA